MLKQSVVFLIFMCLMYSLLIMTGVVKSCTMNMAQNNSYIIKYQNKQICNNNLVIPFANDENVYFMVTIEKDEFDLQPEDILPAATLSVTHNNNVLFSTDIVGGMVKDIVKNKRFYISDPILNNITNNYTVLLEYKNIENVIFPLIVLAVYKVNECPPDFESSGKIFFGANSSNTSCLFISSFGNKLSSVNNYITRWSVDEYAGYCNSHGSPYYWGASKYQFEHLPVPNGLHLNSSFMYPKSESLVAENYSSWANNNITTGCTNFSNIEYHNRPLLRYDICIEAPVMCGFSRRDNNNKVIRIKLDKTATTKQTVNIIPPYNFDQYTLYYTVVMVERFEPPINNTMDRFKLPFNPENMINSTFEISTPSKIVLSGTFSPQIINTKRLYVSNVFDSKEQPVNIKIEYQPKTNDEDLFYSIQFVKSFECPEFFLKDGERCLFSSSYGYSMSNSADSLGNVSDADRNTYCNNMSNTDMSVIVRPFDISEKQGVLKQNETVDIKGQSISVGRFFSENYMFKPNYQSLVVSLGNSSNGNRIYKQFEMNGYGLSDASSSPSQMMCELVLPKNNCKVYVNGMISYAHWLNSSCINTISMASKSVGNYYVSLTLSDYSIVARHGKYMFDKKDILPEINIKIYTSDDYSIILNHKVTNDTLEKVISSQKRFILSDIFTYDPNSTRSYIIQVSYYNGTISSSKPSIEVEVLAETDCPRNTSKSTDGSCYFFSDYNTLNKSISFPVLNLPTEADKYCNLNSTNTFYSSVPEATVEDGYKNILNSGKYTGIRYLAWINKETNTCSYCTYVDPDNQCETKTCETTPTATICRIIKKVHANGNSCIGQNCTNYIDYQNRSIIMLPMSESPLTLTTTLIPPKYMSTGDYYAVVYPYVHNSTITVEKFPNIDFSFNVSEPNPTSISGTFNGSKLNKQRFYVSDLFRYTPNNSNISIVTTHSNTNNKDQVNLLLELVAKGKCPMNFIGSEGSCFFTSSFGPNSTIEAVSEQDRKTYCDSMSSNYAVSKIAQVNINLPELLNIVSFSKTKLISNWLNHTNPVFGTRSEKVAITTDYKNELEASLNMRNYLIGTNVQASIPVLCEMKLLENNCEFINNSRIVYNRGGVNMCSGIVKFDDIPNGQSYFSFKLYRPRELQMGLRTVFSDTRIAIYKQTGEMIVNLTIPSMSIKNSMAQQPMVIFSELFEHTSSTDYIVKVDYGNPNSEIYSDLNNTYVRTIKLELIQKNNCPSKTYNDNGICNVATSYGTGIINDLFVVRRLDTINIYDIIYNNSCKQNSGRTWKGELIGNYTVSNPGFNNQLMYNDEYYVDHTLNSIDVITKRCSRYINTGVFYRDYKECVFDSPEWNNIVCRTSLRETTNSAVLNCNDNCSANMDNNLVLTFKLDKENKTIKEYDIIVNADNIDHRMSYYPFVYLKKEGTNNLSDITVIKPSLTLYGNNGILLSMTVENFITSGFSVGKPFVGIPQMHLKVKYAAIDGNDNTLLRLQFVKVGECPEFFVKNGDGNCLFKALPIYNNKTLDLNCNVGYNKNMITTKTNLAIIKPAEIMEWKTGNVTILNRVQSWLEFYDEFDFANYGLRYLLENDPNLKVFQDPKKILPQSDILPLLCKMKFMVCTVFNKDNKITIEYNKLGSSACKASVQPNLVENSKYYIVLSIPGVYINNIQEIVSSVNIKMYTENGEKLMNISVPSTKVTEQYKRNSVFLSNVFVHQKSNKYIVDIEYNKNMTDNIPNIEINVVSESECPNGFKNLNDSCYFTGINTQLSAGSINEYLPSLKDSASYCKAHSRKDWDVMQVTEVGEGTYMCNLFKYHNNLKLLAAYGKENKCLFCSYNESRLVNDYSDCPDPLTKAVPLCKMTLRKEPLQSHAVCTEENVCNIAFNNRLGFSVELDTMANLNDKLITVNVHPFISTKFDNEVVHAGSYYMVMYMTPKDSPIQNFISAKINMLTLNKNNAVIYNINNLSNNDMSFTTTNVFDYNLNTPITLKINYNTNDSQDTILNVQFVKDKECPATFNNVNNTCMLGEKYKYTIPVVI